MGKLSYGMYLLHLFCLSLVLRGLMWIKGYPATFHLSAVILTTALTVLAAWLMQICIEDPALRLRPLLKRHRKLQYLFAALQVSLIPTGVLLAFFFLTKR
jgi:peptidoglycan/LPS O-acetylase OafA/YrhL